ncbi:hypothetical protein CV103_01860 [Sphingomonas fennica]|uniref:Uncharacterized protein n=2 Tax=Edaphosphingomonas fennica TaxID=114404 RepID=A0A2T4I7G8_9SPHN|nr:hypothetical protein CV103_01860 [Sphingomonas fennica]
MRFTRKEDEPRFANAFVGSSTGRWGLRDPEQERCVLASILEVMGMDVGYVMPRAYYYYPRGMSPAWTDECLFAMVQPGLTKADRSKVEPNSQCRTRARAAWPYDLLWTAFGIGRLKPGPVTRDEFVRVLSQMAQDMRPQYKRDLERREELAIHNAELGNAYVPPVPIIVTTD